MYHLMIDHFPHTYTRFNMTEQQVMAILVPWSRGQRLELSEHLYKPEDSRIMVLEGSELPLGQLGMGRGWGNAQRSSEDVTAAMLARAAPPAGAPADGPLGALLGDDGSRLLTEWRAVAERSPELAPSEALALAEHALRTGARG